ncbi:glycerate kinase [Nesterenkonia natronophila]|uniref:Glycerate kinase n=1 Tax=Nesterenkonia natronophila TaxID=2174932 RepID=A0A3A4FBH9_9MICC|nr:glycerate kinase [Nesterenkonia natronophila]RJN32467.1 glycerate kinase [Nesterenkonia natronophila]
MKIVCAPDSFKGSVSAAEAAAAMAAGAREVLPDAEIVQLPFADGGEGTLEALLAAWDQAPQTVTTVDALGRPTQARYGLSPDGRTAVIEAAEANGLPQVSDGPLQPLRADTYGVGLIARQVLDAGAEEILLCIGGSATTDGGTGILRALGAEFPDHDDAPTPPGGGGLGHIARVDLSEVDPRAHNIRWRIAVDVDNPLTGDRGAAAVFGPQKGATEQDIALLDHGLYQLAEVLAEAAGVSVEQYRDAAGFGAAGGIPLGLVSVFGAEVVPGSAMVSEVLGVEEALAEADLVFTGEGRLDSQSLGGKVVDAIASRAPESCCVVVLAGSVQLSPQHCRAAGITAAFSVAPGPANLEDLQGEAAQLIQETAAHASALCAFQLGR